MTINPQLDRGDAIGAQRSVGAASAALADQTAARTSPLTPNPRRQADTKTARQDAQS
jgi:hypothetical protein